MSFGLGDTVSVNVPASVNIEENKIKFVILEDDTARSINDSRDYKNYIATRLILIEKAFPTERPNWGWIQIKI